ncbi:hypothetical protein [Methylobacterium mesophilicum]
MITIANDDDINVAAEAAVVKGIMKFQEENQRLTKSSKNIKETFLRYIIDPDAYCMNVAFPRDKFDLNISKRIRTQIIKKLIFDIYGSKEIPEEGIKNKCDDILNGLQT